MNRDSSVGAPIPVIYEVFLNWQFGPKVLAIHREKLPYLADDFVIAVGFLLRDLQYWFYS